MIDSFQRVCAGATRGMGRQLLGAGIYVLSYYCMGMPLGLYFAYKGIFGYTDPLYLKGLWIGAAISVSFCSFFFVLLRLWINWDNEIERAQKRMEKEHDAVEEFRVKFAQQMILDSDKTSYKNIVCVYACVCVCFFSKNDNCEFAKTKKKKKTSKTLGRTIFQSQINFQVTLVLKEV